MNLSFFKKRSGRYALAATVVAIGLASLFQNCGGAPRLNPSEGYIPSHSPFYGRRVILDEKSVASSNELNSEATNKSASAQSRNSNPTVSAGAEIALLINNSCAIKRCQEQTVAPAGSISSLVCDVTKDKMLKQLANTNQAYNWILPSDMTATEIEDKLKLTGADDACVIGVSESKKYKVGVVTTTNDPLGANQYHHQILKSPEILSNMNTDGLDAVKVGIIDTGVDRLHEDLLGTYVFNYNLSPSCVAICNFHGTFVGGIIAAKLNNSKGVYGLAPNAQIYSMQVGDNAGSITTTEIVNALNMLVTTWQVEVINMSLGGSNGRDATYEDAVVRALEANITLVIAAGNNGRDIGINPIYPAAFNFDGQINVGSASPQSVTENSAPPYAITNSPILRDTYSNYSTSMVHIAAPGRGIYSTTPGGNYTVASGTSFSTPMVTAAVALAKGYLKHQKIDVSPGILKQLILDSASPTNSLLESINGQQTSVFQQNRYLNIENLYSSLKSYVTSVPTSSKIGLSSSESVMINGNRFVRLVVEVSNIDLTSNPILKVYTNRQFLTESDTGITCRITVARQFCTIDIPYSKLLIDPEVYLTVVNSSSVLMADLNIPKANLNLGSREDASITGEIIAVRNSENYIRIEGWACLIGFPDVLSIEAHRGSKDGPIINTIVADIQARGEYFGRCQAPSINFGFHYSVPTAILNDSVLTPQTIFFRAKHAATNKTFDLPVLAYQQLYQDIKPASFNSTGGVYIDGAVTDTNTNLKIDQVTFDNFQLTVTGSTCYKNSLKPTLVNLSLDAGDIAALFPSVWDNPQLKLSTFAEPAKIQAASLASTGGGWYLSNPNHNSPDNAGDLSLGGIFSEIHQACDMSRPGATASKFLVMRGSYVSVLSLGAVSPNVDRADGCALPSGFTFSTDVRNFITGLGSGIGVTYRTDYYPNADAVYTAAGISPATVATLGTVPVEGLSQMRFMKRAFKATMGSPPYRRDEINLTTSPIGFYTLFNVAKSRNLAEKWYTQTEIYSGRVSNYSPASPFWTSPISIALTSSASTTLATVYQSAVLPLPATGTKRVFAAITYDSGQTFGNLGSDLTAEFQLNEAGPWYDLPIDVMYGGDQVRDPLTGLSTGKLFGNVDVTSLISKIQVRIRANGKNQLRINRIGLAFD